MHFDGIITKKDSGIVWPHEQETKEIANELR